MSPDNVLLGDVVLLHPRKGTLDFVHRGQTLLRGITAWVSYRCRGSKYQLRLADSGDLSYGVGAAQASLEGRDARVQMEWHVEWGEGDLRLWLSLTNSGDEPLSLEALCPLRVEGSGVGLPGPSASWWIYRNGWQSGAPALSHRWDDDPLLLPRTEDPRRWALGPAEEEIIGYDFTALRPSSHGASLLVGFLTLADQLAEIRFVSSSDGSQGLEVVVPTDGWEMQPGDSIISGTLMVAADADPVALLNQYARALGEAMGARQGGSPLVWMPVAEVRDEVRFQSQLEALVQVDMRPDQVVVRSNYARAMGDWLVHDKRRYPSGMRRIAAQIEEAGFQPGIEISPFVVNAASQCYSRNRRWVLRDEAGEPVVVSREGEESTFALDLTRPEVKERLRSIFHTLTRGWHYKSFVLNDLYVAALPGRRYDPGESRASALRGGLNIIREAAGPEAYLIARDVPLGAAVGLVDAVSVGPASNTHWQPLWEDPVEPSVLNALRNSLNRAFLHGRTWANLSSLPTLRRRDRGGLKFEEMRTAVTVAGILGGPALWEEDLSLVDPVRLAYLSRSLPRIGEAVPADLFRSAMPRTLTWRLERPWGKWWIVAVANWTDHIVDSAIRLEELAPELVGSFHVYDYWGDRYLGVVDKDIVLARHLPHGIRLLALKPVSAEPELMVSTFHISGGGAEVQEVIRDEKGLNLVLSPAGSTRGELIFWVPDPYRVQEIRLNGQLRRHRSIAAGVIALGFQLKDRAEVALILSSDSVEG